ncbi:MAG TPA: hypothetical protein VFS98_04005, partial [Methylomirabilota bacterium]|nr:hypothetical protein [Methylomirabilota bacterium]
ELTAADVFPTQYGEEEEYGVAELASILPLRGLAITVGTFVPTFLAIVFGLPYLLGSATTARTPGTPSPGPPVVATAPLSSEARPDVTPPLPETLPRDSTEPGSAPPAITSRVFDEPAPRESPERSTRVESTTPRTPDPAPVVPTPEPAPPPALPPASARAPQPTRPAVARSAPERRTAPEASKRGEWTPAAAFADRDAAGRLASTIEKQGYPVEIRQDGASSRPWVVWIGAQPNGARRR